MELLDERWYRITFKIAKLYPKKTMLIYIYTRIAHELLLYPVLTNRHSGGYEMAYAGLVFNFVFTRVIKAKVAQTYKAKGTSFKAIAMIETKVQS